MEIEIKIDSKYTDPKLVLYTAQMTDELGSIISRLGMSANCPITGFDNNVAVILEPAEIARVYSENQKIYAETADSRYVVKLRLYEIETMLDSQSFVRISNSEIINIYKIDYMDLSFAGTICVRMQNGNTTYVSRRYLPKIRTILNL
jgi:Response regulator of the LytR/AlgR family